jgi:hypothetical protein
VRRLRRSSKRLHLRLRPADLGFEAPEDAGKAAQRRTEAIGALDDYPHIAEIVAKLPESGYDTAADAAARERCFRGGATIRCATMHMASTHGRAGV